MSEYLNSAKETLSRATSALPTREGVAESANNLSANVQSSVQDVKNSLNGFSSKNVMNASSEFLNSNSIIAKFAFLILVLVAFIFILKLSVWLIAYFLSPSKQPYLVKGMIPGNIPYVIQQDPNVQGAIPLERSTNKDGIEFSWSVWLNITSVGDKTGQYQHIFHKGEQKISPDTGLNFPNNAPGLYVAPHTNKLVVMMNTFTTINEEVDIPNFPMNKWVHVVIRVTNNVLDVYINGSLAKRHILSSVPKQNDGNVYVALNGGFSGNLSNLRYYNYSLQPGEILSITNSGPNLTVNSQSTALNSTPPYLSLQWYTSE